MRRHCLTGKQRAFRWVAAALCVLLLALGLYWLDNRPCLTTSQAIREAERREATQQTVLLESHTIQDTDFLLTGNEDVLLVVRFHQRLLERFLSTPGYLIAFDRNLPPFDPSQESAPLRCGRLILEPADGASSPRFLLVLGTTDHPQGACVVLTSETADAWTATIPLEESPFGCRYFWFWKELSPRPEEGISASAAQLEETAWEGDCTVTLLDGQGQSLGSLTSQGFSLSGSGSL